MTHYICTGMCGGVSETPGVCQAEICPLHGKPLVPCDCTDGKHHGIRTMHKKKVLLLVAQEGFQSKEYFDTRKTLEQAGIEVVTAAPSHTTAVSHINEEVMPDLDLKSVRIPDYNGIFAVGGSGALKHLDNEETVRIFKEVAQSKGYPYGAICISPRILARAGVLQGKRATGWDEDGALQEIFDAHGVTYIKEPVVVDGSVITANGPSVAHDFANTIARVVL